MDDLSRHLTEALDHEGPERDPDVGWVVARGRKLRTMRLITTGLMSALLIGASAFGVASISDDQRVQIPIVGPSATPESSDASGVDYEDISEQQQAEIFAFRAMAHAGLMEPFTKRVYTWTYRDDTTATEQGWRIGFAATDCEPRDGGGPVEYNCEAASGEEPESGNALTDTYLTVAFHDDEWEVIAVEGNMLPDEQQRILGFVRRQRTEPSHWEFPSVGVRSNRTGANVTMFALWVGPYPTSAPGSVCTVTPKRADGQTGEKSISYQEPPSRSFEVGGWVRGLEVAGDDVVDADVECSQYTGRGWELDGEAELVTSEGSVVAVSAELVWKGDEGFTTPASCHATLVDADGEQVWEGTGRAEALWRPGELKDYPYRTTVLITTRGDAVDAEAIGEFTCRSV